MANDNHSALHALGAERLSLIGKHADALMQGYVAGKVDEAALSERALNKLVKARILWRPDEQQPLCLRPAVNELIASLTEDERKRQINADVAGQLDQIRTRVASIRDALFKGDYAASEHHFQLLTEKVHDMEGQFSEAISSLWNRLNSDFGFVSSMADKIRENELAQKQLRRLLDGFELIDFNDMIDLAEGNGPLRKLLVSQLQANIADYSGSLLEVQKRLVELMAKFRQQQERALLISNMSAFLKQHPNFSVGDYPRRSNVPAIVNQAKGIRPMANIALDRVADEPLLSELVRAIPRTSAGELVPQDSGEHFTQQDDELVAARQQQLKLDVENFFIAVLDSDAAADSAHSALAYLENTGLAWDGEIWLFQVIAEFEGLSRSHRDSFIFIKQTRAENPFNQVEVIFDVHLSVNTFGAFQVAG